MNMKHTFLITTIVFTTYMAFGQNIAINTTGVAGNTSAILDVSAANKGMLIPRVALTNITDVATIATPANGLIVYNTNAAMTNGNGVGTYYYCSSGCTTVGWKFMSAADNGPGTTGQVLTSQGAGAELQWTTPTPLSSSTCLPSQISNAYWGVTGIGGVAIDWMTCLTNCSAHANRNILHLLLL